MTLSVVIVNYNVKYYLEQCLESVFASELNGAEMEVIVIDNASKDGSQEYISSRFPQVKYVYSEENMGFSRANNCAFEMVKGDFVLMLNPDTMVGERVFSQVIAFMKAHENAGAVGVKMINSEGVFLPESKRGVPTLWVSFCKFAGLCKLFPKSKFFNGYYLGFLNENETQKVPVLAGAFIMTKRSVLDRVGGLDERFFMFGEDIDFSVRISEAGYDLYYYPVKILHYKGESCKKNRSVFVMQFYDAMVLFYKKYYGKKWWEIIPIVWLGAQIGKMISMVKGLFTDRETTFSGTIRFSDGERFEDAIERISSQSTKSKR